jgi:hypothetical protein
VGVLEIEREMRGKWLWRRCRELEGGGLCLGFCDFESVHSALSLWVPLHIGVGRGVGTRRSRPDFCLDIRRLNEWISNI